MGVVPYIMPGFALAKKSAEVFDANPEALGLILHKHGIFTFGDTAREAYERMIEMVSMAEERLAHGAQICVRTRSNCRSKSRHIAEIAPIVRGACALADPKTEGAYRRLILEFRSNPAIT